MVLADESEVAVPSSVKPRDINGKPAAFQLSLRNLSAADAFGVKVRLKIPRRPAIVLDGPDKVNSYEAADYTFSLNMVSKTVAMRELLRTRVEVVCTNCSGVIASRN